MIYLKDKKTANIFGSFLSFLPNFLSYSHFSSFVFRRFLHLTRLMLVYFIGTLINSNSLKKTYQAVNEGKPLKARNSRENISTCLQFETDQTVFVFINTNSFSVKCEKIIH